MEDKAHECAADHRIFQDILNQNGNRDLAAPEQFQNHDRRYVVDRNKVMEKLTSREYCQKWKRMN